MDYQRYVEALGAGNDAEFVREWYTEDCIVQRGPQALRGRRELLEFLTVKYFALYLLRDGKVAHFKMATWPPEAASPKPPRA